MSKGAEVTQGVFEEDSHADTCLLCDGWRVLVEHDYSCTVSGFTDALGSLSLQVVDAVAKTVSTDGREVLLRVNQALYKPGSTQSLLSTPQVRDSGTRVDTTWVQHDATSNFGLVLEDGEHGRLVIPFTLDGVSGGFSITSPDDEELDQLPIYEITSSLHWDPNSEDHAKTEARSQKQRDFEAHDRILFASKENKQLKNRRVNLSAVWTRPTDSRLVATIAPGDDGIETDSEADDESSVESDDSVGSNENGERRRLSMSSTMRKARFLTRKLKTLRISKLKATKKSIKNERRLGAFTTGTPKPKMTPEQLAKKWGCSVQRASATLEATTHRAYRDLTKPFTQRLRTRQATSRRRRYRGILYTDTMHSGVKSMKGNSCGQLFVTDFHDVQFHPLKSKQFAYKAVSEYFINSGVPEQIHSDNAKEMTTKKEWRKTLRDEGGIKATTTEPHSPFQNRAEREIRQLQSYSLRRLRSAGAPLRLWDDSMKYHAHVRSLMARPGDARLNGKVPRELIESNTPDISEYVQFEWYQPVFYWEKGSNPKKGEHLGRVTGIAHSVGQAMCFEIVPMQDESPLATFKYLSRSTVRAPTPEELAKEEFKEQLKKLDGSIHAKAGNPATEAEIEAYEAELMPYEDTVFSEKEPACPEAAMPDQDDEPTPEETDEFINVQALLPKGDGYQRAHIQHRKRNADGELIGQRHSNPILDTRTYEAVFADGSAVDVAANTVAASLLDNCDDEGNEHLFCQEILEHRSDETAVQRGDGWIHRKGLHRPKERRRTTKGWSFLIEWKDGHQSWEKLSDLKESLPVEVAEYAKGNGIIDEPAFAWWAPRYLKEKRRILKKVKSRYWKRTHKYGVEVPKSVAEAYALDRKNGNNLWREAIEKEMRNNKVAFQILGAGERAPRGYERIVCHMIFDVKMDGAFTRKARYVANGNMIDAPPSMTYASVVSRDSVRIALTLAALNNLDVQCADVQNAYLNAKPKEKVYTIAGDEFGQFKGRTVMIVRALYGLKGAGAAWAAALRQVMRDLEFVPCKADGDVWMRPAVDPTKLGTTNDDGKPSGERYYEYVLIHTDDLMVVSRRCGAIMEAIGQVYKLKEDKETGKCYGPPDIYLGSKIGKHRDDETGKEYWTMSGDKYVANLVADVKKKLEQAGRSLNAKQKSPFTIGYRPEMDTTPELGDDQVNYFQEIIGCLRWAIELGRADIALEVSLLSRHLALPRRGHLEEALNVVAYLDKAKYSKLAMRPEPQEYLDDERLTNRFTKNAEWFEFYGDVKEDVPSDAPVPLGRPVEINAWVDADHAGDRLTRRSHTGILIFLMSAPIFWYSKRQATIESSTFGSEIVALRTCLEFVKDLRYKLRMMGVPIDGPAVVWCDNKSVANGAAVPEAKLNKKHLGICYHAVREASAAGVWMVGFTHGKHNIADMLTKILSGFKKEGQAGKWMYGR